MSRAALVTLVLLFACVLCAQDTPKVEEKEERNDKGVVTKRYRLVDGKMDGAYYHYYDDGKPAEIGSYTAGQRDGEWVSYHLNERKSYQRIYRKGRLEGAATTWYEDGTMKVQGDFLLGRLRGKWTSYHSNGKVYLTGEAYDSYENDLDAPFRSGTWTWHFPSGAKQLEIYFSQNAGNGPAVSYFEHGGKYQEGTFEKGHLKGKWTQYHGDGKVAVTGDAYNSYRDDLGSPQKTGTWTWFYEDGVKSYEAGYNENHAQGPAVSYHRNGGKYKEGTFEKGHLKGKWTQYHGNGTVAVTGEAYNSYRDDLGSPNKTGTWTWFYDDGVKSYEAGFTENVAQGPAVSYHRNGGKYQEGTFENGHLKGKWTQYHSNGTVVVTGQAYSSYRDDLGSPFKTGGWTWFYDDGVKSYEAGYTENVAQGPATRYHRNGSKSIEATFEQGRLQGTWIAYFDDGTIYRMGQAYSSYNDDIHSPFREGRWIQNYQDGKLQFEGNYNANHLDGTATSYHRNGAKATSGEFIEGRQRGLWTAWYDNGNLHGKGHAYDSYTDDLGSPFKNGPWVWHHSNGNKESQGSYQNNQKVGAWLYFTRDGKLKEVKNHLAEGGEGKLGMARNPDGSTTASVENADGSRDVYTWDKDGNLKEHEHVPPPGERLPSISSTDPETGETTTIKKNKDGSTSVIKSKTTEDADGTRHTRETRDDGATREITEYPDGSRKVITDYPDGTHTESSRDADGTLHRSKRLPDGTTVEMHKDPDGSISGVKRGPDGEVLEEMTRDPSGVETRKRPDGTSMRRWRDSDGNIVEETTYPDGTKSRTTRGKDGGAPKHEGADRKRDPGQALYEDVFGGRNWAGLDEETRKRYAEQERKSREGGSYDDLAKAADEADFKQRQADSAAADKELADAAEDADAKPAADEVEEENKRKDEKWAREGNLLLKAVEWALSTGALPLARLKETLGEACKDDDDLLRALKATDRNGLLGFLKNHPKVADAWVKKVLPTLNSAQSILCAVFNVVVGVDQAWAGKYREAFSSFADAGIAGLKAVPPGEMAKITSQLGRSPVEAATALKHLLQFAYEALRTPTAGSPRNYAYLLSEGVSFLAAFYESTPEAARKEFIARQGRFLNSLLGNLEARLPAAKRVIGLITCAPEIWALYSEWNTSKRYVHISNLAQKLGPKIIGTLVFAATRNQVLADWAELAAQLGADYLAHLGQEARDAMEAAMKQEGDAAAAYAKMRNELQRLAMAAGLTRDDALAYEALANLVSGTNGQITLSNMRRQKDLVAIRQAIQAWRAVDNRLNKRSAAVLAFYGNLVDSKSRDNEGAYQSWKANEVDRARRTIQAIDIELGNYSPGTGAHTWLLAWRQDLQRMVQTFG